MVERATVDSGERVTGTWQRFPPLPIDGSTYTEPRVIATDSAAYTSTNNQGNDENTALNLPAIGSANPEQVGIIVAAFGADNSQTGQVTTGPRTIGRNEIQRVEVNAGSGSYKLTFRGVQTTVFINWNQSRSGFQTNLQTIPELQDNIVVRSVQTRRPFTYDVEFINDLAGQNVPLMTPSVSTSIVVITERQAGSLGQGLTLVRTFNVPPAGQYEPGLHVWAGRFPTYQAGAELTTRVSTVTSGLHTWAEFLAIIDGATDAVLRAAVFSFIRAANVSSINFNGATPAQIPGAKMLGLLAKAVGPGFYAGTAPVPTVPKGFRSVGSAAGNAASLDAFLSPALPLGRAFDPPAASWSGNEDAVAAILQLDPLVGAGSLTVGEALGNTTEDYIEIAAAAGDFYEVIELDLTSLPADAVLLGVGVQVRHQSNVASPLRVSLAGIRADGTIEVAADQEPGGYSANSREIETIETLPFRRFADDTVLRDYPRLGVVIRHTGGEAIGLTTHKIYTVMGNVEFEEGAPTVTNVAGPSLPTSPITWNYSSSTGIAQSEYRVIVAAGLYAAGTDFSQLRKANDPLNPTQGEIMFDSGFVAGPLVRSLIVDSAPLERGRNTVAVQVTARFGSGIVIRTPWIFNDYEIQGTPGSSGSQGAAPVFNRETGTVDVAVAPPSNVTRAWLARSVDNGASWTLLDPFTVVANTPVVLPDANAPLAASGLRYRVAFDQGPMTETTTPTNVGPASATVNTAIAGNYLLVPSRPALSTIIDLNTYSINRPKRVVRASQPGGSVVASSRDLGKDLTLTIRVKSPVERAALEAVIDSGEVIRFVDVWGREYLVVVAADIREEPQSWVPVRPETTALRDAALYRFTFTEVHPQRALAEVSPL